MARLLSEAKHQVHEHLATINSIDVIVCNPLMMNLVKVAYATHNQSHNSAPRLGYLIKLCVSSKRTHNNRKVLLRVEVYRIPQGATAEDALAGRNGAIFGNYVPGGEDVTIHITAADLGITDFRISAKDIFDELT